MPWMESRVKDERMRFVLERQMDELSMRELCLKYGISRAPHRHPNQVPEDTEEAVLDLRRAHPTWGPKKLCRRLEILDSRTVWPARSTIAAILHRNGFARAPRRRRCVPPYTQPFASCTHANDVWRVAWSSQSLRRVTM